MNVVRVHLIKVIISFIIQEFRGNNLKGTIQPSSRDDDQERELENKLQRYFKGKINCKRYISFSQYTMDVFM